MAPSPELDAKRKELRERATKLLSSDHFALLGVSRTASVDDVKRAYLEKVKAWHPDRVPPALEDLRPIATEVFARLDQAHATLTDPSKRLEYASRLAHVAHGGGIAGALASSGANAGATEAAIEIKKAEALAKKNDVATAKTHAARAVQLAPGNVDYQAFAISLEAVRLDLDKGRLRTLVSELDKLVVMDDRCERAIFVRAQLKKRLELEAEAMKDFVRVTELNPKNVDAAREVRIHTMRKEREAGAGTAAGAAKAKSPSFVDARERAEEVAENVGGFFKKLFNRD